MKTVCSVKDCENERRPKQHYCRSCHAAYMREQRAQGKNKRKIDDEERRKIKARNAANRAVRDGVLEIKTECERCQATGYLEKHHHDYDKPLEIEWLCLRCHYDEHKKDDKMAETG